MGTKNGRVCAKRLDSRGGWGMRLRVKCTRYRRSFKKIVKRAKKAARVKSRNYDVTIGNSRGRLRCQRIASNVKLICPSICTKRNRINRDYRTANDRFRL